MASVVVLGLSAPSRSLHAGRHPGHRPHRSAQACLSPLRRCSSKRVEWSFPSLSHVPNVLDAHISNPPVGGLPVRRLDCTSRETVRRHRWSSNSLKSSLCLSSRFGLASAAFNVRVCRVTLPANMAKHAIPVLAVRPTHRLTCTLGLRIQPAILGALSRS